MSIDIGGRANPNVSAGASIGGGIGGTLAGALGGSLSGGIGVVGGLALTAATNFVSNLMFSAGLPASIGAPTVTPGMPPPDIYPIFRFIVQIAGLGPVRFQACGPIGASPGTQSTSGTHNANGSTASTTQHVAEGGRGGATVMLPSGAWKWDDLVLKRGLARDGTPLMNWIMLWTKGYTQKTRTVTVISLDAEGKPAMTWVFQDCFPKKWLISTFDASKSELVIETLTLGYQNGAELILS